MSGKFFQFMVFKFLENALNLWIFTHGLVPQSNLQVEFFENLFPKDEMKRVEGEGNYDLGGSNKKGGGNYDLLY